MGIYEHLMIEVEVNFKNIKEKKLDILQLYKNNMKKVFNNMLLSLEIDDSDIEKPLTNEIFQNPYSGEV